MDIHAEKIALTKLLLNTDNLTVIQSIRAVFKKENSIDFWDTLTLEQQKEINNASKEIKEGVTVSYDTFMEKHR